jgi:hypothetical protein
MKKTLSSVDRKIRQIIGMLSITLIVSIVFFIADIREVRHDGMPHPRNPLKIIASGTHIVSGEVRLRSVDDIESWMTFSYINFAF